MNTHGMTGAPLQQPDPAPLRSFAAFDRDKPCTEHSTGYSGAMPCTGDYRCRLCGTIWDDAGQVVKSGRLARPGNDNYGKPKQDFVDKLAAVSDEEYLKVAEERIWLSAYANNNPRSDYHWQADACYDEAVRRGRRDLYDRAWHRASGM